MDPKIPSAPGSLLMHRQLKLSIVILLGCAVVSIVGFMVLGWLRSEPRSVLEALHITANIFTTVGNIDAKLTVTEKVCDVDGARVETRDDDHRPGETEAAERRLMRAGASRAICLPIIGALKVNRMLLYPAMEDLLEATHERDIVVDHLNVSDMPEFVGRSLRELALPSTHGVIVLAVDTADGDRRFNPPADHTLGAGEQVIVVGPGDALEQLESVGRS